MIVEYRRGPGKGRGQGVDVRGWQNLACDFCGCWLWTEPRQLGRGVTVVRAAREAGWLRRGMLQLHGALADSCPACTAEGRGAVLTVAEVHDLRAKHAGVPEGSLREWP